MDVMNPIDARPPLVGRTALVTGASRGIGRALAEALARAGARVIVNFREDSEEAESVVGGIRTNGGEALAVRADISRVDDHESLLAAARSAFGPLHILINNAGVERRAGVLDWREADWDEIQGVNLRGVFFLTQAAARDMIAAGVQHGRIINVSSTHEHRPMARAAIYNISKAGLAMLTKSFALELAPHGITVNGLVPGAIRTDINREVLADPAYEARVVARIPLGHIAAPPELGAAAVFLAGAGSAYMTGSTLTLDGGLSL